MIPLEKQVCSLEISKELKELGVPQDSLWWWVNHWQATSYMWDILPKDEDDKVNKHISAFTCSELGEMFPEWASSVKLPKSHGFRKWVALERSKIEVEADTEADARGRMLIYLIKQGHINPKELK